MTSQELQWCLDHGDVPEAAAVLRLVGEAPTGPMEPRFLDALNRALSGLRKLRPRPMAVISELYAYCGENPDTPGVEGVLAYHTTLRDLPGGISVVPALGTNIHFIAAIRPTIEQARRQGIRVDLRRFAFAEEMDRDQLMAYVSPSYRTGRVQELFAYISDEPETGDEALLMVRTAAGGMLLSDPDIEKIRAMWPLARKLDQRGTPSTLRRFALAETVDESNLRAFRRHS